MTSSVASIFEQKPNQWGLRGDSYLWEDLQAAFDTTGLPCSESHFLNQFNQFFQELTDHPFNTCVNSFHIKKYDFGGMSSGYISMTFWQNTALPQLLTNLQAANRQLSNR